MSENFEPRKTLISKPDLQKPDLDLCILKLNDLLIESAMKTFPANARGQNKKKAKDTKNVGLPRSAGHLKMFCENSAAI